MNTKSIRTIAVLASLALLACSRQETVGSAAPDQVKTSASTKAPEDAAPLRVAFVYVSPVGDAGWTSQHNTGRLELEKRHHGA